MKNFFIIILAGAFLSGCAFQHEIRRKTARMASVESGGIKYHARRVRYVQRKTVYRNTITIKPEHKDRAHLVEVDFIIFNGTDETVEVSPFLARLRVAPGKEVRSGLRDGPGFFYPTVETWRDVVHQVSSSGGIRYGTKLGPGKYLMRTAWFPAEKKTAGNEVMVFIDPKSLKKVAEVPL